MNSATTQPTAIQQDAAKAARALGNAQTLLRDLRREAIELPVKMKDAQASMDIQQITALRERRRTLPASVHMARMTVLAAGIEARKAELVSAKEAEAQLVKEAAEIQEQTRRLQARMKDLNDRLLPVRSQVHHMTNLIERKADALSAEEAYMRSPEAADDPTDSVWAMLPGDPDQGLQALITQIGAIRAASLEDEAHTDDDARLAAVLKNAIRALRGDDVAPLVEMTMHHGSPVVSRPGDAIDAIPAGDKQTLLSHLREELALILGQR